MAARMYLVFCDFSSRVSKPPSHRLRGPHGVSAGQLVWVLQPQTAGGLSRSPSSTVLCALTGLEPLSGEKDAASLYGQTSG